MSLLSNVVFNIRTGILVAVGCLLTGLIIADLLSLPQALALICILALAYGLHFAFKRWRSARAARKMQPVIDQMERASPDPRAALEQDVVQLRQRMREAIQSIRSSRLGESRGGAALYALPWYMIIGNPAAGKSTAIINSGLRFPFSDERGRIVQGIGGTRSCDWYFTTEGILLDTAGRYAASPSDRNEWFRFLDLLRRHRPLAPINGILVGVSIAELGNQTPDRAIELARTLRERLQELTERLAVFAPVYVIFTKLDLLPGFSDFFGELDAAERERPWGATLPFDARGTADVSECFDREFDILLRGLRSLAQSQMALRRGREVPPALLTLPQEFAALRPLLHAFIATLFEDNPYQFRPVFRGFYFTSATQGDEPPVPRGSRVAERFGLDGADVAVFKEPAQLSYFLRELFSRVIFGDQGLVRQYTPRPQRLRRHGVLIGGALLLGLAMAGWTWSYIGNRQLLANARSDLEKAEQVQKDRVDLQSRLDATMMLQDRLVQLGHLDEQRPWSLGLGLYHGRELETALRHEYFHAMRELMLQPVQVNIEHDLGEVSQRLAGLSPQDPGAPRREAEQAYDTLKAYLMLSSGAHLDNGHLADQLGQYWRPWLDAHRGGMSREDVARTAGQLISFYLSQDHDRDWPRIDPSLTLIEAARQSLRPIMLGMPAQERVYADIKARAGTRFAAVSVASMLGNKSVLTGSVAVPGSFTRDAWENYVSEAIEDAAKGELSRTDWVLDAAVRDDLTLSGSPEHIQKQLVALYKADYILAWQQFLQNVSVEPFENFAQARADLNVIGDPQNSPLATLLREVQRQTSWDNPSAAQAGLAQANHGIRAWFLRVILRRVSAPANEALMNAQSTSVPHGVVGDAFYGLTRLVEAPEKQPAPLDAYLESLGHVRSRFNLIAQQGDPGPGAMKLMKQTLDGSGSELGETLKLVDEQLLNGLPGEQRSVLRPLLLRPLMQAFGALVQPTEQEVNRVWTAQVYQPFTRDLAGKYPFDTGAGVEATASEIGTIFGPSGDIAAFADTTLGSLVVRRGNTLTPRQWADVGIALSPVLIVNYDRWVRPLGQVGVVDPAAAQRTTFQIRPRAAYGLAEYTVSIDGQSLRYRNTPPQWNTFVWPMPGGVPGVRVEAVTMQGLSLTLFDSPGPGGLSRLFQAGSPQRTDDGGFVLSWAQGDHHVSVDLRIISSPEADAGGSLRNGLAGLRLPASVAGADANAGPAP